MCYSAMVKQSYKKLQMRFDATADLERFEELFKLRLEGSGAKIPRAMEADFLDSPRSMAEVRIAKHIRDFHAREIFDAQEELAKQEMRLLEAERTLKTKVTKKALNDQRIATEKISKLSYKIKSLTTGEMKETDSRIWPHYFAPLVLEVEGRRLIQPFRYHLRPLGQAASFDRKYDGTYNARRDRIEEVRWWKTIFGRNHGIMDITAFFENVKRHDIEHRSLAPGEAEENLILRFEPQALAEMSVPCIWDYNEADKFTLHSFALITDEPNPEVAAAGHDRTPIILRDENIGSWLRTGQELAVYQRLMADKQPTYFEHRIAA